jgi:DNA polymerase III subunit delta'
MARAPAVQQADELPEADRLDGFPHPRATGVLIGHDRVEQLLLQAFAGGRMHHAWLLAGGEGIGKATLAYRLARYVLALPEERDLAGQNLQVSPHAAAARQVTALSHPGLLVLRRPYDPRAKRFAASIPVDEVRRVKSFLGLTGADNAWRVVIVDSADELNPNAANALLKSLEEPPARALFLLVSAQPGGLLPTIRSRCRRLDLEPLAADALRRAVTAAVAASDVNAPPDQQWPLLERLAEGSVRRALQLAASGGLELYERIETILSALPKLDWAAVHALSDELAGNAQEQRFEAFYDLYLDLLARLIRARATEQGETTEVALAFRLIGEGRLPAWASLWETALRQKTDAVLLNLDRKALIVNAFVQMQVAIAA